MDVGFVQFHQSNQHHQRHQPRWSCAPCAAALVGARGVDRWRPRRWSLVGWWRRGVRESLRGECVRGAVAAAMVAAGGSRAGGSLHSVSCHMHRGRASSMLNFASALAMLRPYGIFSAPYQPAAHSPPTRFQAVSRIACGEGDVQSPCGSHAPASGAAGEPRRRRWRRAPAAAPARPAVRGVIFLIKMVKGRYWRLHAIPHRRYTDRRPKRSGRDTRRVGSGRTDGGIHGRWNRSPPQTLTVTSFFVTCHGSPCNIAFSFFFLIP